MPPQVIIMGIPMFIIAIMRWQHSMNMSFMESSIGIISHFMPVGVMVQVIEHIIIAIGPMPFIIGIMPPIIGIIPFIIGIIPGIMEPIIGMGIGIGIGIMAGIGMAAFITGSKTVSGTVAPSVARRATSVTLRDQRETEAYLRFNLIDRRSGNA